ncbi:hypothetical protein V8G54_031121, partial [Vigna mungo]
IALLYHLIVQASNDNGTPRKQDLLSGGQKKLQTNVRTLRGHNGAITALHCVTKREVWDLVGDREDAGFFISGSTDCSVSCVRTLSGERVLTASHDGTVKMWDVRTDRCVATVGRCSMLAAGGRDVYVKKKQCWSPGFPCAIQLFAIHCLCNA